MIGWISSGAPALDEALGGGYPTGRIVELFGEDDGRLRSLCLHAVAACQHGGPRATRVPAAAWIDARGAFSPQGAEGAGIALDRLVLSQPDTFYAALATLRTSVDSGALSLVIVDGLDALLTPDADAATVSSQLRRWSETLRAVCAKAHRAGVTVITATRYEPGVAPPGSNAIKFYASIRVDVRRSGTATHLRVVKNKTATPFKTARLLVADDGLREAPEDES